MGFKIAGNGIRYTHGNGNFLVFFLCKRQKCDMIAWSGQIILKRSDKTHIRFILRDSTPPAMPLSYPGTIFREIRLLDEDKLYYYTTRDCVDENSGLRKSKNCHGISWNGPSFTGNRDPISPWWAPGLRKLIARFLLVSRLLRNHDLECYPLLPLNSQGKKQHEVEDYSRKISNFLLYCSRLT